VREYEDDVAAMGMGRLSETASPELEVYFDNEQREKAAERDINKEGYERMDDVTDHQEGPRASSHHGTGTGTRTSQYTPEDDERLVAFVAENPHEAPHGHALWQRAENVQLLPGRTWKQMMARYGKIKYRAWGQPVVKKIKSEDDLVSPQAISPAVEDDDRDLQPSYTNKKSRPKSSMRRFTGAKRHKTMGAVGVGSGAESTEVTESFSTFSNTSPSSAEVARWICQPPVAPPPMRKHVSLRKVGAHYGFVILCPHSITELIQRASVKLMLPVIQIWDSHGDNIDEVETIMESRIEVVYGATADDMLQRSQKPPSPSPSPSPLQDRDQHPSTSTTTSHAS